MPLTAGFSIRRSGGDIPFSFAEPRCPDCGAPARVRHTRLLDGGHGWVDVYEILLICEAQCHPGCDGVVYRVERTRVVLIPASVQDALAPLMESGDPDGRSLVLVRDLRTCVASVEDDTANRRSVGNDGDPTTVWNMTERGKPTVRELLPDFEGNVEEQWFEIVAACYHPCCMYLVLERPYRWDWGADPSYHRLKAEAEAAAVGFHPDYTVPMEDD